MSTKSIRNLATIALNPDRLWNSIFLVEFSGNIGRNGFLTSIASQKIFRPYFQKSRLEYYFLCLFYFSSPYSGHLRSDFVVLLLLLTARCRRTRKADQKCPEKQDKKSKRDMKKTLYVFKVDFQSKLKPKYDILLYVVIIILWGKIKITTNYKISYFGFNFNRKSI